MKLVSGPLGIGAIRMGSPTVQFGQDGITMPSQAANSLLHHYINVASG